MRTLFVTRHPGAIEWARTAGHLPVDAMIVHDCDPATIEPGDIVIGTLPAHLAAQICERGGRYFHLSQDLSLTSRGRELTAEEMRACNARIEEYTVVRVGQVPQSAGG